MKTFNNYVNESFLIDKDYEEESLLKNKACIEIIKSIGENVVDKLSSNNDKKNWFIYLTSDNIDLIKLSNTIVEIKNNKKYDCIKSIFFNIGMRIIYVE